MNDNNNFKFDEDLINTLKKEPEKYDENVSEITTIKEWLIFMVISGALGAIHKFGPIIVGVFYLFVAFTNMFNKNIKTFVRAMFIFVVFGYLLYLILRFFDFIIM